MFDSFIDTVGNLVTRTGIIEFNLARHFSNLEHIDDATNAVTGLDSGSCKTLTTVKHEITYVHVIETGLDITKCTVVSDVFVNLDLAL